MRNPKTEDRRPKEGRNPKSEEAKLRFESAVLSGARADGPGNSGLIGFLRGEGVGGFGPRFSGFLRFSAFGFRLFPIAGVPIENVQQLILITSLLSLLLRFANDPEVFAHQVAVAQRELGIRLQAHASGRGGLL